MSKKIVIFPSDIRSQISKYLDWNEIFDYHLFINKPIPITIIKQLYQKIDNYGFSEYFRCNCRYIDIRDYVDKDKLIKDNIVSICDVCGVSFCKKCQKPDSFFTECGGCSRIFCDKCAKQCFVSCHNKCFETNLYNNHHSTQCDWCRVRCHECKKYYCDLCIMACVSCEQAYCVTCIGECENCHKNCCKYCHMGFYCYRCF